MMVSFERSDVVRILDVDDAFLEVLERESIVYVDVEERRFSPRMVERVRVAHSLVFELEVNLSGVAVILRMREELGSMQGALSRVQEILHERDSSTEEAIEEATEDATEDATVGGTEDATEEAGAETGRDE